MFDQLQARSFLLCLINWYAKYQLFTVSKQENQISQKRIKLNQMPRAYNK